MVLQTTRFTISKNVTVVWSDDCDVCSCGMWINRMALSPDETRLVIYLECPHCGVLRVVTFEPLEFAPHTISKLEV